MPTILIGWPPIAPPVKPVARLVRVHRLGAGELRHRRDRARDVLVVERAERALAVRQDRDLDRRAGAAAARLDGRLRSGASAVVSGRWSARRRRDSAAVLRSHCSVVIRPASCDDECGHCDRYGEPECPPARTSCTGILCRPPQKRLPRQPTGVGSADPPRPGDVHRQRAAGDRVTRSQRPIEAVRARPARSRGRSTPISVWKRSPMKSMSLRVVVDEDEDERADPRALEPVEPADDGDDEHVDRRAQVDRAPGRSARSTRRRAPRRSRR